MRSVATRRPVETAQMKKIDGRQNERDEPLRQKRRRARRPEERRHAEPGSLLFAAEHGRASGEKRRREEERQEAVGQVGAREEEAHRRGEEQDGRRAGRRPRFRARPRGSESSVPRPASRVGNRAAHGVSPKTRRDAAFSPVEQRRLLEVRHAVQARDEEVPGREHLPRDLGVAGLVGLGEAGAGRLEPDHGEEEKERGREGCGIRGSGRNAPPSAAPAVYVPSAKIVRRFDGCILPTAGLSSWALPPDSARPARSSSAAPAGTSSASTSTARGRSRTPTGSPARSARPAGGPSSSTSTPPTTRSARR